MPPKASRIIGITRAFLLVVARPFHSHTKLHFQFVHFQHAQDPTHERNTSDHHRGP